MVGWWCMFAVAIGLTAGCDSGAGACTQDLKCPGCDYSCTAEIAPRTFRQCGCACSGGGFTVACVTGACPARPLAEGATCPAGLFGGIARCEYGGIACNCDSIGRWTCTGASDASMRDARDR
jgi:hypothetical protein